MWYTFSIIYREEGTGLTRRKTHDEYIRELKEKGIQAEPLEPYKGANTKIKHRWKSCGHVTEAAPKNILAGCGCGECRRERTVNNHEDYLDALDRLGLEVVPLEPYKKSIVKLKHQWKKCGHITSVSPNAVLARKKCGECARRGRDSKFMAAGIAHCKKFQEGKRVKALEAIDKVVIEVHGDNIWRDPNDQYITARQKIGWCCKNGHSWKARPSSIKQGKGCPECAEGNTKGETYTREVFKEYGIEFQAQKKFANLYHKSKSSPLSYDFFIPSMGMLIECQGKQHYEPSTFFHGENAEEGFADQQERDQLKREYAWENGYYLLEISYKDYRKDRIKAILEDAGVLQKQPA